LVRRGFPIRMASLTLHGRAASSSPSSPYEERVGRGPKRRETNKNAPPLPDPLLHPMAERVEIEELDAALARRLKESFVIPKS
jgi:hypothetical protein